MIVKYVILCFHGVHARLTHLEVGGLKTATSRYRRPIAHPGISRREPGAQPSDASNGDKHRLIADIFVLGRLHGYVSHSPPTAALFRMLAQLSFSFKGGLRLSHPTFRDNANMYMRVA